MSSSTPFRIALGPQLPQPNLGDVASELFLPEGNIAVISASWQEAEGDHEEYQDYFKQPLIDLDLYQRTEKVFAEDPQLWGRYRERQQDLQELQTLYRSRLRQLKNSARNMLRSSATPELLEGEQRHAMSQLRALDRHHLKRVAQIHQTFDNYLRERKSGVLLQQREEIDALLHDCGTVIITGGNILVLLNRIKLFDLGNELEKRNIIAWSAGAMVLSDVIVLFHDRTPQGRRESEILGYGLGLIPGFVLFPDAKKRLRLRENSRLDLLRRRFAPARCLTLENGSALQIRKGEITAAVGVNQFVPGNQLSRVHA